LDSFEASIAKIHTVYVKIQLQSKELKREEYSSDNIQI